MTARRKGLPTQFLPPRSRAAGATGVSPVAPHPSAQISPRTTAAFFGRLLALTPPEGESPNRRAILHLVVVMKVYSKKPMELDALENQLIARGLIDGNRKLRHALETVGYFRLTGYLYPFRKPNSDDYKSGTTFESLWSIYTFDRKLRLMAADALARIEVAVRSLIVTSHTAAFPNDAFAYIDHNSLPGLKVRKHTELLNSISAAMGHAKGEPDLKHLKTEYDIEHYPPIWNVMEHAPFGLFSRVAQATCVP